MSTRGSVMVHTRPDALPVVPPAWVREKMAVRGAAWALRYITSPTTGGIDRWRAKHPDLVAEIEAALAAQQEEVAHV